MENCELRVIDPLEVENQHVAWYKYPGHCFGCFNAWNGLFKNFDTSTDLDGWRFVIFIDKNDGNCELRVIEPLKAKNRHVAWYKYPEYCFDRLKVWNALFKNFRKSTYLDR